MYLYIIQREDRLMGTVSGLVLYVRREPGQGDVEWLKGPRRFCGFAMRQFAEISLIPYDSYFSREAGLSTLCVPPCRPGSTITLSGIITRFLLCSETQAETAAKYSSHQYGLYLSPLALAPCLRFSALVSASSFAGVSVGSGALHARTHPSSPAAYTMLD